MAQVIGHQDEILLKLPANQCWCQWRLGLPCPNDWTHCIENLAKPGYMKCCEQHKDGFLRICTGEIKVWTKEEWEKADREQLLLQEISNS